MPCWSEIQNEIGGSTEIAKLNDKRMSFLASISEQTGRNTISYYSAFLQKPNVQDISINDLDTNAFMEAVYKMDRSKGLDIILHTPGGDIAATESIINYLHSIFNNDIRAIIPQMAMSAGSLISVSCKEIIMGKQSCLGPFDPQIGGIACQSLIKEFEEAKEDIKHNPQALGLWQVIVSKYHPTLLISCKQAISLSDELANKLLIKSIVDPEKIKLIKAEFNDNGTSKTHSRHISKEKCKKVGLNIIDLESDQILQDLVLSLHHCYMITFEKTYATKIVENNIKGCYLRLVTQQSNK